MVENVVYVETTIHQPTTNKNLALVRLYYQNNIPQKGSNPSVAVKKYCLNANQKLKASNGDTSKAQGEDNSPEETIFTSAQLINSSCDP
ncbi:hypothetical protein EB796_017023 [Bugula neritina]|uniref:Uncharacterized protein n=1 Tax=Bugula neritina TaxID=10212 RepID=A0A7J7JGC4_BUGNE|nr:hypothetical protein EB796_017023 [Bugula neritina]